MRRVCCWCGRILHSNNTTHGSRRWDPSVLHGRRISGGICRECYRVEMAKLTDARQGMEARRAS